MAITAFNGPPGAGKSHALVKDLIIPALLVGRRVLTNVDGIDRDAVRAHCLQLVDDAGRIGELLTFHGEDAAKPGFFPDETTSDAATFVKGGDLVVFDEWALTFPRRGAWPKGSNVEPFLRWHRHLTGENGQATDVAIGTQLATDIHPNVRGLVSKSYKFKKLTALGAEGQYAWQLFDGHLQPKGGYYRTGTGSYDKAIFPLYSSSSAAKEGTHVELRTNKKESIRNSWQFWAVVAGAPLGLIVSIYFLYASVTSASGEEAATAAANGVPGASAAVQAVAAPVAPPASPWRIIGQIEGPFGVRVVVADEKGATRILRPGDFNFDEGRPVSGMVDGRLAQAEDRLPVEASASSSILPGGM